MNFKVQWENMSGTVGYTKELGLIRTIFVLMNLLTKEKLKIERL